MGRRIRDLDWSATPIGPREEWPRSLRTAVGILLHSQYPMFIWWGPERINIYNDAYIPVLGARHPDALGAAAPRIWAEIWDVVGPQSDIVFQEGRATWNESSLLVMERYGYAEETYFTFSYSPVPDDAGGVGGLFCACTEETGRVLGERRLRTLRELGERSLAEATSTERVCAAALEALGANPYDFPFALVYLVSEDASVASLAGAVGIDPEAHGMPAEVVMDGGDDPWGFGAGLAGGGGRRVDDLEARFGRLPAGAWKDDRTRRALVVPLARSGGEGHPAGFLVSGLSPRLAFGADYESVVELAAGQLDTALANVRAYEKERERAAALAELDRAKTVFFSNVSHEFRSRALEQEAHAPEHRIVAQQAVLLLGEVVEGQEQQRTGDREAPEESGNDQAQEEARHDQPDQRRHDVRTNSFEQSHLLSVRSRSVPFRRGPSHPTMSART
jgi:GAF domain-containing protein